tara:strand:- start:3763 stop:3990 length:228 start_codon:yes stop_codon:yes gene_type:complete
MKKIKKNIFTLEEKKKIISIFDQIQKMRAKNNKNWMDILKLSFLNNPKKTYDIISLILDKDSKMIKIEKQLKRFI